MTVLRFQAVSGRFLEPVPVSIVGPCDGHDGDFRVTMPDGVIGCVTASELTDD